MKNNKGLIIGIIGLIIVMIGGTYAYYRWNSTENINVSINVEGSTVTFVGGDNVTGVLVPTSSKEGGIKKDITVTASEKVNLSESGKRFCIILIINVINIYASVIQAAFPHFPDNFSRAVALNLDKVI